MSHCIDINTTETDSTIDCSPATTTTVIDDTQSCGVDILTKEIRILEVSDENSTVRVQLNIKMSWLEYHHLITFSQGTPTPSWTPDLQFSNVCPLTGPQTTTRDNFTYVKPMGLCKKGTITCNRTIVATLDTSLDHFCFPFDRQMCDVKVRGTGISLISSLRYGSPPCFISPLNENLLLRSKTKEWYGAFGRLSCFDNEIHMVVCVERMPYYYLMNIALILSLITAMAAYPFWIDADDLGSRLGLNFTLVLTAVAFKFTLSTHLPRIPYLTYLDFYVLANFGFIIACGVEHVIASTMNTDDATHLDNMFLLIAGITWLVVHVLLVILGMFGLIRPEWSDEAKRHMIVKNTTIGLEE